MKVLGKLIFREEFFRGFFFLLAFCCFLIPLSIILNETDLGYVASRNQKLNHLLFMADLKLYAKRERELDLLIQTLRICSDDVGMVFGLNKFAVLVLKKQSRFEQREFSYQTESV